MVWRVMRKMGKTDGNGRAEYVETIPHGSIRRTEDLLFLFFFFFLWVLLMIKALRSCIPSPCRMLSALLTLAITIYTSYALLHFNFKRHKIKSVKKKNVVITH